MASSTKAGSITVLALRVFVFLFLLVSLVVIATDTVTVPDPDPDSESETTTLGFKDIIAYRYVFSVAVIGCVYTLLQLPFAALNIIRGKKFIGRNTFPLYIFIDLVFSLLFASGVGAGFGITVDLKRYLDKAFRGDDGESSDTNDIDKALDLVHVSTGFVLVATVCMAFIILTSTFALAKK
ncbi:CASP-like protein 4D1 [Musa acuminata AAA Group]|uniref:CASP-like protein 4D1 n=1 Tax=Musa acuminata AAA Group TaxID=214697 RepID=UPI0031D844A6